VYNKNLPFHARHLGPALGRLAPAQVEHVDRQQALHVVYRLLVRADDRGVVRQGDGGERRQKPPPDSQFHGGGGEVVEWW
jgi:hypothetical protein